MRSCTNLAIQCPPMATVRIVFAPPMVFVLVNRFSVHYSPGMTTARQSFPRAIVVRSSTDVVSACGNLSLKTP